LPDETQFLGIRNGGFARHPNHDTPRSLVIRRFQIEDLIYQDTSGVTFRALDAETGDSVALRRFFPFGPEGGGLQPDEQTAYNIALERLAGISHPSLRAVVAGGCDPVDGIPFIATEWVDGDPLHVLMNEEPVTADSAAKLVTQALEVCELLSHVLAEESVWIDTEVSSIVVGAPKSGREYTFWISPLKWLGGGGESRGLKSIVTLTEELMGWQGLSVNDQAGRGLGIWLKWLRAAAETTTLKEARESLTAAIGVEPPPPVKTVVATSTRPISRAARPIRPIPKRKSKAPVFTALILLCVVAGGAGWWWVNRDTSILEAEMADVRKAAAAIAGKEEAEPAATASKAADEALPAVPKPSAPEVSEWERHERENPPSSKPSRERNPEDVQRRINELSAKVASATEKSAQSIESQQAELEKNGGVYSPSLRDLLMKQDGKPVEVKGRLKSLEYSNTKKSLYLVFDGDNGDEWSLARGCVTLRLAANDLKEEALKPLVGKTIKLKGVVDVQRAAGKSRPLIGIKERSAITEAP